MKLCSFFVAPLWTWIIKISGVRTQERKPKLELQGILEVRISIFAIVMCDFVFLILLLLLSLFPLIFFQRKSFKLSKSDVFKATCSVDQNIINLTQRSYHPTLSYGLTKICRNRAKCVTAIIFFKIFDKILVKLSFRKKLLFYCDNQCIHGAFQKYGNRIASSCYDTRDYDHGLLYDIITFIQKKRIPLNAVNLS